MNAFAAGALKHRHARLLAASRTAYVTMLSSLPLVLHPNDVHNYPSVRWLREAIADAEFATRVEAMAHDQVVIDQQLARRTNPTPQHQERSR